MKKLTNNQILLEESINQEFKEYAEYEDLTINDFFEYFAASQLLKDFNLSDEEIEYGCIGGANDGGCDNIYIFLNGDMITSDMIPTLVASRGSSLDIYIIQSKKNHRFSEVVVQNWKTTSSNLLDISKDNNYKSRYSESLVEKCNCFKEAVLKLASSQVKIRFFYYYVSLGLEPHQNVIEQARELEEQIKRNYPSADVIVDFVGADKLMQLYSREMNTTLNLDLADQPISLSKDEYVCLVNLGTYYKFITNNNNTLKKDFFESNVRDYQGSNSVNSSIAKSLEDGKIEDFWALNNGVTILSSNISLITNKSLSIVNPQIVNGLQTSREIYNYFLNDESRLSEEKRHVLVRVIKPQTEESRDRIIFSTNNQTSIPKSSLRVTDPIHFQLEMYFRSRGLYYDRRKNYYKNEKKKPQAIISVSFLAQCLISIILRKPDFARARPSTLLSDDKTYQNLYDDNNELEAYFKAAKVGRKIQIILKKCTKWNNTEVSDILFYVIYATVASELNKKIINFEDLKELDVDEISDQKIIGIADQIYEKYKELGGNSTIAKDAKFIDKIYLLFGWE